MILLGGVAALSGCAIDPGATWAPEELRAPAPKPVAAELPPDVRTLLKTNIAAFFLPQAAPTGISFSVPRPERSEWTTCIRATVNGATGRSIGVQTYLVNLSHGQVVRQEHVDNGHRCTQERFEAL